MPPVRHLAAILAADVAGYSRLMGVDEEGTHERLKAHLAELVNPKIAERRGRIVKNTGDGFLAEFTSVVDAVRCAAEVQHGMAERNADAPAEERIEFRVGINLGDVIVEEHDIFGDGVNVAARLEALAEPGGICVSGVVRDPESRTTLIHTRMPRSSVSMPTIRIPAGFDCMPGAAHFVDKELTDEVTVAAKELVPATRMSIYEKMQLQFMERAPCAMLLQQTEVAGLRKGVSGMRIGVIPDYTIHGDITKH